MNQCESVRYLIPQIIQDLQRKMVLVAGPRQVGKTTLAKHLLSPTNQTKSLEGYLNWDIAEHRERILNHQLPDSPLWVLDEIHKYRGWRAYLKGLYDQYHGTGKQLLVIGSAHLDYYRHGGDSLQGRYYYLRLHPLSVAELGMSSTAELLQLFELGGFPEPFFAQSKIEAKRWSREYRQRLIQEDLVSLERVNDLGKLELLMLRLPQLVGSPLSLNSLREDLNISHKTVQHWLSILDRLYGLFFVPPFGAPHIRAVKKAQKHYHYDWTLLNEPGLRFENLVASHALKWVNHQQDTQGRELALRYFRDIDGREVDFVVTEQGQPILAIECKYQDSEITKGLQYFKTKFPDVQAYQISLHGQQDYLSKESIRVCPAIKLLTEWV